MDDERSFRTGESSGSRPTRRSFLAGAAALGAAVTFPGGSVAYGDGEVAFDPQLREDRGAPIAPPDTHEPRHWLGPELWGNRLQDWRAEGGRVECLRGEAGYELRTVGVLTRELVEGDDPAHLRVRTGVADDAGGGGFAGFLVGVGGGDLDHRAAALAGRSSGGGGGLLCTYGSDGRVRFRDHTDEERPVAYEELPTDERAGADRAADEVDLSVDVLPEGDGEFTVHLSAFDPSDGTQISGAVRRGVPEAGLLGGVSLVSSPTPGEDGTRWWFEGVETAGPKVADRPERTFGPVVGTLYTVTDSVLKLSAQMVPLSDADPDTVELRYRPADGESWRVERATVGAGHSAQFRVEEWDASRPWRYEVRYTDGTGETYGYEGRIDADPGDGDELTVGMLGCTIACARQLDVERPRSAVPQWSVPDRYSPENIYFPYSELTDAVEARDPDLLVSTGDQFYEGSPTGVEDREDPGLDYLYKWYLWLWAFRDLTRDTPTVVMVDDHDVFQANLWGAKGKKTTHENLKAGGYVGTAEFVKRVMRTQTGHDPDPDDPTPVKRGIPVNYGSFTYGGTEFALVEGRKFKPGPKRNLARDPADRELLGERQQTFLEEWAERVDGSPAVCLTHTVFSGVHTEANGEPFGGYDTNAYPTGPRDRALESLREAGAVALAGDQHLATLVRHGVDGRRDGAVQFTGPAGGTLYQRWFEPGDIPGDRGYPNTGVYEDGHGNEFRSLAVANPKPSYEETRRRQGSSIIFDQDLKSEGFGVLRVDHDEEAYVFECWPRTADPTAGDGGQFAGWPYRLPFDEADGRE